MKKTYQNPAMEMISLMNEDILTTSYANGEVFDLTNSENKLPSINFGGMFGNN